MLRDEGKNHRRIFRALALMNGGGIGQGELIEFPKGILDSPAVKVDVDGAFFQIDLRDAPDVALEHFFLVVVDMLEDFITRRIRPAKALNLRGSGGIEALLEHHIERSCPD